MKILPSILALSFLFMPLMSQGQLLKRVLNRASDKIANRAEQMAVEKASEAIARAVMGKVEQEVDEAFQNAFAEQDSISAARGTTVEYPNFGAFMAGMNKAANVPPSYQFDLRMLVSTSHKGKQEEDIVYYFSKTQGVFAVETRSKGEKAIMLMDTDNDLMVMYNEKNGKKSANALPNMIGLGAALAQSHQENESVKMEVRATGQSKSFAGYSCEEYEIITTEKRKKDKTISYVTNDLDVQWSASFEKLFAKFLSKENQQNMKQFEGMPLASYSYDRKGKQSSSWVTKEVETTPFSIDNSIYQFETYETESEEAE